MALLQVINLIAFNVPWATIVWTPPSLPTHAGKESIVNLDSRIVLIVQLDDIVILKLRALMRWKPIKHAQLVNIVVEDWRMSVMLRIVQGHITALKVSVLIY